VTDDEVSIPGFRAKVFSFDSQQKTNLFSGSS
jgi:hypothetical protein